MKSYKLDCINDLSQPCLFDFEAKIPGHYKITAYFASVDSPCDVIAPEVQLPLDASASDALYLSSVLYTGDASDEDGICLPDASVPSNASIFKGENTIEFDILSNNLEGEAASSGTSVNENPEGNDMQGSAESQITESCQDISGPWNVEETGTFTVTVRLSSSNDTITDSMPVSAIATISIEQNGCNFSFDSRGNLFGQTITAKRTGYIKGSFVHIEGDLISVEAANYLIEDGDITVKKNILSCDGQFVSSDRIEMKCHGEALITACQDGECEEAYVKADSTEIFTR